MAEFMHRGTDTYRLFVTCIIVRAVQLVEAAISTNRLAVVCHRIFIQTSLVGPYGGLVRGVSLAVSGIKDNHIVHLAVTIIIILRVVDMVMGLGRSFVYKGLHLVIFAIAGIESTLVVELYYVRHIECGGGNLPSEAAI